MERTPMTPTEALGHEVSLECFGGPCDGEWLTHDHRTFAYTRHSPTTEGWVTSLYQVSPRLTPQGLSFVWLYVGDQ